MYSKSDLVFQDDDSAQEHTIKSEQCLGQVCIGQNVTGQRERAQWLTVMTYPRKVFTNTFRLE